MAKLQFYLIKKAIQNCTKLKYPLFKISLSENLASLKIPKIDLLSNSFLFELTKVAISTPPNWLFDISDNFEGLKLTKIAIFESAILNCLNLDYCTL